MATTCSASGTILKGDAVCLVAWDSSTSRATVARATAANLATSKTIYGVAAANSGGSPTTVSVLVAGEVADDSITSLSGSAGWNSESRIVATDIYNATTENQCKLIVVNQPDGSEFVVGTCDEGGNLAVVPRASRETSSQHVFNVKSYGAVGDGVANDSPAFLAVQQAISSLLPGSQKSAIVEVPEGNYLLSDGWDVLISAHFRAKRHRSATPRTKLILPPGQNIRVWKFAASPTELGDANDATLEGFIIDAQLQTDLLRWPGSGGSVNPSQKFRVRSGAVNNNVVTVPGQGNGEYIVTSRSAPS